MPHVNITHDAADPKRGLTFAELRAFVTTAMRNNVTDDTVITARVTMGGKLKQISTAGPGPDSEPGSLA